MQADNNKISGKSHLQQSVFTKSLAGVLILGGLAIGANRGKTVPAIPPEQTVARQSAQPRTAAFMMPGIMLPTQVEQVRNDQLAGIEQAASIVLAIKP